MQRLSVLFPSPLGCYDYKADEPLPAGTFVTAPFGRRETTGVVWDSAPDLSWPDEKIKPIYSTLPVPPLPAQTIEFVNWVAGYTLSPLGAVLKMALIPDPEKVSKKPVIFERPKLRYADIDFSPAQKEAVTDLTDKIGAGFSVTLLDGVTGSGKTEVYFESLAKAIETGGQVLVLLPEIILTTAWLTRFEKRFGVAPALWHSSVTPKQRRDTWQAVQDGTASVIVGARSALFLPFKELKLIIIDEEHDASFKQEDGVLYHARDMGIVRAKIADCPIVLASATPSVETYCNVQTGRFAQVTLPERFAGAVLPDIQIVDMRQKTKGPVRFISPALADKMREALARGEQTLLFLNRRGYAPLILCRGCGERLKCPNCSAWLVEHKRGNFMQCHHCGYTKPVPTVCPTCETEGTLVSCGPGVERIYEEAHALFPQAVAEIVTSDTLTNPKEFAAILARVQSGEINILIGTQILAKGHHFPNLTLVGIIDADMGLSGGDLRASERTFQLLHQVMGRAGREAKKGTALLQSYTPENMIIQSLKENNRDRFLAEEITARQILHMPPFGKLAALIISGKDQQAAYGTAKAFAQNAPYMTGLDILGPVPAPIAVLRGKFRFRLLVKAERDIRLQPILKEWLRKVPIPASVDVRLDIDPYSFF